VNLLEHLWTDVRLIIDDPRDRFLGHASQACHIVYAQFLNLIHRSDSQVDTAQ
jgi:hypothetical protein